MKNRKHVRTKEKKIEEKKKERSEQTNQTEKNQPPLGTVPKLSLILNENV